MLRTTVAAYSHPDQDVQRQLRAVGPIAGRRFVSNDESLNGRRIGSNGHEQNGVIVRARVERTRTWVTIDTVERELDHLIGRRGERP